MQTVIIQSGHFEDAIHYAYDYDTVTINAGIPGHYMDNMSTEPHVVVEYVLKTMVDKLSGADMRLLLVDNGTIDYDVYIGITEYLHYALKEHRTALDVILNKIKTFPSAVVYVKMLNTDTFCITIEDGDLPY